MIATALLALLAQAGQNAQTGQVLCPSLTPSNGLCNQPSDAPKGATWDFIPIDPSDCSGTGPGFYVFYSRREGREDKNVNMFILPLENDGALIYGSGYGDLYYQRYSVHCDAGWVTQILRDELGLDQSTAHVHFVTPHGHYDHVNDAFLRTLRDDFGWNLVEVAFHEADWDVPGPDKMRLQSWSLDTRRAFNQLHTTVDADQKLSEANLGQGFYQSPLGVITIHHRPGHTPGATDLILWTRTGQRIMVRGSIPPPNFPDPAFLQDVHCHNNVLLQGANCGC